MYLDVSNMLIVLLGMGWRTIKNQQKFKCHSDRNTGKLFAGSLGSTYEVAKCKA